APQNAYPLKNPTLPDLARLSLSNWRDLPAWESPKVYDRSGPRAWESQFSDRSKGRTTDGEYASRRTFAADDAGTADGCRCQQRCQHQHDRLQGRPVAVRGISALARA